MVSRRVKHWRETTTQKYKNYRQFVSTSTGTPRGPRAPVFTEFFYVTTSVRISKSSPSLRTDSAPASTSFALHPVTRDFYLVDNWL